MFSKKPAPVFTPPTENLKPEPPRDEVETVVGPSVCVEGDFSSEGRILVKGTVCGSVKTSKLLTVEPGAKILANVKAGDALISGQVKGNVKVDNRLELSETAQIEGDVWCKELIVACGALMSGKVQMKGINIEEPKLEKKSMLSKVKMKEEENEG
jgi:cytoskeletal protein CcmA (bactofilin family)